MISELIFDDNLNEINEYGIFCNSSELNDYYLVRSLEKDMSLILKSIQAFDEISEKIVSKIPSIFKNYFITNEKRKLSYCSIKPIKPKEILSLLYFLLLKFFILFLNRN